MRSWDFDEWLSRPRENARLIAALAERQHLPRRKPRDPVEARLLQRAALESMRRREAEGRLVRIGPRDFELRTAAEAVSHNQG